MGSMFFIVNFRLVSTEEFISTPLALCTLMRPLRLIIFRFTSSFNHLFVIFCSCYSGGSSTLWECFLEHRVSSNFLSITRLPLFRSVRFQIVSTLVCCSTETTESPWHLTVAGANRGSTCRGCWRVKTPWEWLPHFISLFLVETLKTIETFNTHELGITSWVACPYTIDRSHHRARRAFNGAHVWLLTAKFYAGYKKATALKTFYQSIKITNT